MKTITGLLCALLFAVLGTVDSQAQSYCITNSSPVPVFACVQTTCGALCPPAAIPPGATWCTPIPAGCVVQGVLYNGIVYAIGYAGPLPPPNPPTRLRVGTMRAIFY